MGITGQLSLQRNCKSSDHDCHSVSMALLLGEWLATIIAISWQRFTRESRDVSRIRFENLCWVGQNVVCTEPVR